MMPIPCSRCRAREAAIRPAGPSSASRSPRPFGAYAACGSGYTKPAPVAAAEPARLR